MSRPGAVARAAELASLGHERDLSGADVARRDSRYCATTMAGSAPPRWARSCAAGPSDDALDAWRVAAADADPAVRRRAAELAPRLAPLDVAGSLVTMLDDADVTVVEAAAWALGELGDAATSVDGAVTRLAARRRSTTATRSHAKPRSRRSARSATPAGLAAILSATTDRPAVRRRAVLALAPFDGADVDAAIERALTDNDWQVRQAAEDLRDA